jgi:hypothetical protein
MITSQSLSAKVGEIASEYPVTKNSGLKASVVEYWPEAKRQHEPSFLENAGGERSCLKKSQWNPR